MIPGELSILGAVLAGGKSTRFGSDKAVAIVDELPLIDHVVMGLFRATDFLVISGRDWRDFEVVPDGDFAGEGPLAGLLAVLRHAAAHGFDAVLTAPCDALPVPNLRLLVGDGPAVIEGHWLLGYWPAALAEELAAWLAGQPDRSVRGWLIRCGAQEVPASEPIYNLNTQGDMIAYEKSLEAHA